MRNFLKWIISNTPAMNVVMIMIIVLGAYAGMKLRRETFPDFDLEYIMINVPYPGATPEEVENGICQKIEEALQSLEGVKKITATASEGAGSVTIELRHDVKDIDRVLNEVKDEVDRISSFPEMIEQPIIQRLKMQETVISIGVLGPEDDSVESALALRQVAEDLRQELLEYPRISMVNLVGTKDYQIDIEIPEETLRAYNLTLDKAAAIVRAENVQTPGGTIRAPSQEINVRTDNRRYDGPGIGELPLITTRDGTVLRIKDVANIRDEFVDGPVLATVYTPPPEGIDDPETITGRHVVALGVLRNTNEDLLAMVDDVHQFIEKKNRPGELPEGYSLIYWGDRSTEIRSRLELLAENGIQGFLIVFILLTLFLDLQLAIWVAIGIPFSMCFTALWLYGQGFTLNMISTFAFILGLGIVVDDSIVAGENIYAHRQKGKNFFTAAVDGILEVLPPIASSVLTTVIAFVPLLFVSGMMGKIIYVVPVVMITMLLSSMAECFAILPCHLAHRDNLFLKAVGGYLYIFSWLLFPLRWASRWCDGGMRWAIANLYAPAIAWTLRNRLIFVTVCICSLTFTIVCFMTGRIPYVFFPKMDGNDIQVTLSFPNGTPSEVTEKWTEHIERAFWRVAKEYESAGTPVAERSFRVVGTSLQSRGGNMSGSSGGGSGHQGGVQIQLISDGSRTVSSMEIANRWREAVGIVPGTDEMSFDTQMFGPPGGAIEFLLVARSGDAKMLEAAVEDAKAYLEGLDGVKDVSDSDVPGKYEFRMKIKESAMAMGLHPEDLASVIRATYYGAEVQRLQRGRHEVKVMVCYPREDRRSLGDFNEIRIRTAAGDEYPITELAEIDVVRGYTTISRRNQQRSITVSADVDESKANAQQIITDMKADFLPKLQQKYPGISVLWEGHEQERAESEESMLIGFVGAICGMFFMLALQFRSYIQPFIVLAIIPFGFIGAVGGHLLFGQPMSQMSFFGLIALAGIITNDSIVMIDFINRRVREGAPIRETLIEVGQSRFRPVMLTSVTTMGGLLPIVLETSFQAQMVIPMALSLAGGVAFAFVLVLFFVPVLYSYYVDLLALGGTDLKDVLFDEEETPS